MTQGTCSVAVIIPVYNEQDYILDTLRAIDAQEFDSTVHRDLLGGFRVIVVDNNSTDRTAELVNAYIEAGTRFPVEIITETEKGSGCAADSGAKRAIELGAKFIARTDADSLPATDWLAHLLIPLFEGKHLVGGRVKARSDEGTSSFAFNAIGHLWRVGHAAEWLRTRRGPEDQRRSFAVVGNNMAIDAEIYSECGGFPRTNMSDLDDDYVLQQRVRHVAGGDAIALQKDALVYTSLRRLEAFGVKDFVAWYHDRDGAGKTMEADVR